MVKCPECRSERLYHDGIRHTNIGEVQRYLCRACGYRFSQSKVKVNVSGQAVKGSHPGCSLTHNMISKFDFPFKEGFDDFSFLRGEYVASHVCPSIGQYLNRLRPYNRTRRVCDCLTEASKNLTISETQNEKLSVGSTDLKADIKGKIVEYCFHMRKQGYSEATIRLNRTALKVLTERGADLLNAESVKEAITKQKWSENRKRNVINAYGSFLKYNGLSWDKPKCNARTQKIPFIPNEAELDVLISGTGKKLSTFLQLLKETAMRCGEAKRLQWIDVDFEKNIIRLNEPEKGSNSRMWKTSQKLIAMLNALPRESQKIFGDGPITSMKTTFIKARRRLAAKLQNPRLLGISFHTLRHWKATMLYHQTKDPYYVKQFLGHKELRNTEIYINIERTMFEPGSDGFTVKVTDKAEEVKAMLEVGFEYVCQKDNLIFLRKRK